MSVSLAEPRGWGGGGGGGGGRGKCLYEGIEGCAENMGCRGFCLACIYWIGFVSGFGF